MLSLPKILGKVDKIYNFLTEKWLIADESFARLLATVLPAIKAGNTNDVEKRLTNEITAYATTPYLADRWELDDGSLPANSVAVINLEGPLYSWETFRLERLLIQALNNDKIAGVVLWINGPGGMALHVDIAAALIEKAEKPIAAYIAGTMSSAHFWIGTAAARTFIASPLCTVGSVGTMGTYMNFKEFYKLNGIDYRDIYPDSSDLKNRWFRDIAEKNDETRVKKELEDLHSHFAKDVAKYLGIEYNPEEPVFRGEIFNGDEAVNAGYVDQFGSFQDAVTWVLAQATIRETSLIVP